MHLFARIAISVLGVVGAATAHARVDAQHYFSIGAPEGELIIVPQAGADEVLVHYKGFSAELDGQTKRYLREQPSPQSKQRIFRLAGSNRIHLRDAQQTTLVLGTEVPYLTLLLGQGDEVKVVYAERADIDLVRKAEAGYLRDQGHTDSRIDAKKQLQQAVAGVNQRCGATMTIEADWDAYDAIDQKSVPGRAAVHLETLGEICQRDEDYLRAVRALRMVRVSPPATGGAHAAKVNQSTLELNFDADTPNLADTSAEVLENAL